MIDHDKFMKIALDEAQKAYAKNEVPVGAVIVKNGIVIAKAHNLREQSKKTTAHAEILAIEKANKELNSWRLDSCTMYVTIEPCPMCSGAIIQSRIKHLVYGAKEQKSGSHNSVLNLFQQGYLHQVNVSSGIMEQECSELVKKFFVNLRNQ